VPARPMRSGFAKPKHRHPRGGLCRLMRLPNRGQPTTAQPPRDAKDGAKDGAPKEKGGFPGFQIAPQGWEFYAVTGALFLTFAFPGFVYRYLYKNRN